MAKTRSSTTATVEDGPPPGIRQAAGAEGLRLHLAGDWTIADAGVVDLLAASVEPAGARRVEIDGRELGRIDTSGAWAIERLSRRLAGEGIEVSRAGFQPAHTILLEAVSDIGLDPPAPVKPAPWLMRFLDRLGRGTVAIGDDAVAVLATLGEFVSALGGLIIRARRMRWAPFVNHVDRTGLKAVPIVALMSFLIGMILAQQGAFYFRTYGADIYVVDLVGILVCREIGVLLTAIMVAGRSGSAFTAEIGSMKMREEIDALTVLGVSPVDVLVVPRLLALVIAVPILTLVSDIAAIAGGWMVLLLSAGIPTDTFLTRLQDALSVSNVLVGLAKAPVMALTIGLIACVEGLKVSGSAESLGSHTTASVVKAIFMVIVMDGVFAIVFSQMGI